MCSGMERSVRRGRARVRRADAGCAGCVVRCAGGTEIGGKRLEP